MFSILLLIVGSASAADDRLTRLGRLISDITGLQVAENVDHTLDQSNEDDEDDGSRTARGFIKPIASFPIASFLSTKMQELCIWTGNKVCTPAQRAARDLLYCQRATACYNSVKSHTYVAAQLDPTGQYPGCCEGCSSDYEHCVSATTNRCNQQNRNYAECMSSELAGFCTPSPYTVYQKDPIPNHWPYTGHESKVHKKLGLAGKLTDWSYPKLCALGAPQPNHEANLDAKVKDFCWTLHKADVGCDTGRRRMDAPGQALWPSLSSGAKRR